jgi:hypothetical protein
MGRPDDADDGLVTTGESDVKAEQPSVFVPNAVAAEASVDPFDLTPLAECIDPDALDALAASGDVAITFTYEGYRVEVEGPTGVRVEEIDPST